MSKVSGVIPYALPILKNILQKCHNPLEIAGKTMERIENEKKKNLEKKLESSIC
jgi:hypothetical protein